MLSDVCVCVCAIPQLWSSKGPPKLFVPHTVSQPGYCDWQHMFHLVQVHQPDMVCLHKIFKLSKHDVCVAYKLKSPVHCNRMFGWDFTFLWTWDKNKAEPRLLPKCVEVTSAWGHMHFKLVSSSMCLKVSAGSLTAPSTYTTPQWFT